MDVLASQTRIHTSVHRKRRARGKEREREKERGNVEVGAYRYMRVQQRQMAPSLRERSREKDDIDHSERVQHETCTTESASRGRAHVRKGRTRCNGATMQPCIYTYENLWPGPACGRINYCRVACTAERACTALRACTRDKLFRAWDLNMRSRRHSMEFEARRAGAYSSTTPI